MPVSNIAYYFREAFSSLYRNFWLSLASIGVIVISLFILGSSTLLVLNMRHMAEQVESSLEISVFLEKDITGNRVDDIEGTLKTMQGVESIEFISSSEALEELKESFGEQQDVLQGLEEDNPLPETYRIKTSSASVVPSLAEEIRGMDGVEKVRYGQGVVEKLMAITGWVRTAGIALMCLMGLASVFLIATTIRMSIFSRRQEIEVMKYLGASNWFVRMPFLLEGMVLGLAGGAVTAAVLHFGYSTLVTRVTSSMPFVQLVSDQVLMNYTLGGLIILGVLIGVIGSGISVRRFLRV